MEKIKIVILGGGLAGLPFALLLEKNKKLKKCMDVVMIDQREYFEMNCESVRFLVKPEIHHEFVRPYSKYLKTTRFICAKISTVHAKHVEVVQNGETALIPYDYLVVALGTHYEYFKATAQTIPQRGEELTEFAQRIRAANRILVVGGRTVGTEFIGEILAEYPEKEVILVHSGPAMMDEWSNIGISMVTDHMKKKRLTIIKDKKVVKSEGNLHQLSDGSVIEADMKVVATGMRANSQPLQPLLNDALTTNGYLRVRPTLQVEGHDNVFAIGDILDLLIPKLAANIRKQKKVIATNLQSLILGKRPTKELSSSKLQNISIVSIGPSYAIMAVPVVNGVNTYVGNRIVSLVKTHMFIRLTKTPSLI